MRSAVALDRWPVSFGTAKAAPSPCNGSCGRVLVQLSPRILLVEDSADLQEMWQYWLTWCGFRVNAAADGVEALRLAAARRPDLVLMDLWLPIMDGIEAITHLRARASTATVPIIALTANPSVTTEARARASGCDYFVSKPITPDELLAVIRTAFSSRKRLR